MFENTNGLLRPREEVIRSLREILPGKNLYPLAQSHGITISKEGRKNKGWVGQTLERVANLPISNAAKRDGFDFELKSTTLLPRSGGWVPKETIKITQLNPTKILEEEFLTSLFWQKLERLIFVGCHHVSDQECVAVKITSVDLDNPLLVAGVRAFWEDVRHTVCNGEMAHFPDLGKSEDLVQLRPTGDGKLWSTCPITGEKFRARAFYATKRLIGHLFSGEG